MVALIELAEEIRASVAPGEPTLSLSYTTDYLLLAVETHLGPATNEEVRANITRLLATPAMRTRCALCPLPLHLDVVD